MVNSDIRGSGSFISGETFVTGFLNGLYINLIINDNSLSFRYQVRRVSAYLLKIFLYAVYKEEDL